ncbi:MAG: glycosyltransferase family 4 protein, partial [Gammaproteobacteria bacterium]|nr:glycosyltransferase family 4 protein [Gammaproteobacteria bacterium]
MTLNPFFELPNPNPLRCHVFSLDNVPCNTYYSVSPFAEKLRNVCWQLKSVGHEVFYYGYDVCDVECDEKIEVITEEILFESRPQAKRDRGYFNIKNEIDRSDGSIHLERLWTVNAGYEFRKRYKPGDFCFWMLPGCGQRHLYAETADLPVTHVEAGIGYNGGHLPYKVFESMYVRDFHYGVYHGNEFHINSNIPEESRKQFDNVHHYLYTQPDHNKAYHLDAVIPNSFDISLFDFKVNKGDNLLYLGRVLEGKGIKTAVDIAEEMKMKLIVAGPGDYEAETGKDKDSSEYVEVIGTVGPDKRRELLANARAILCLTYP